MKSKYSKEVIVEEAKKYSKRWDFQKLSSNHYQAAKRMGILEFACEHMNSADIRWSKKELAEEAKKYSSRGEFQKFSKAYRVAYNQGCLDEICAHMVSKHTVLTDAQVQEEALKYENRSDFFKYNKKAYSKAYRNGNLDLVCAHMGKSSGISSMELSLIDEVKKKYPKAQKFRDMKVMIEGKPHIKGFELDIYIPELRKGIEFDGDYWHSIPGLKRSRPSWTDEELKDYEHLKDSHFASKGITIYHVKEGNWVKDKSLCLVQVLNFLLGV